MHCFLFSYRIFRNPVKYCFKIILIALHFLIISWAISCMRYKNKLQDFNNRKIIQKKNDELKRVNKEYFSKHTEN